MMKFSISASEHSPFPFGSAARKPCFLSLDAWMTEWVIEAREWASGYKFCGKRFLQCLDTPQNARNSGALGHGARNVEM